MQLLDTVETINSVVNKGADYFNSIGIDNYDFLYVETKVYNISNGNIATMINGFYSKEFINNHMNMFREEKFNSLAIMEISYSGDSWVFNPEYDTRYKKTYFIYGIKL